MPCTVFGRWVLVLCIKYSIKVGVVELFEYSGKRRTQGSKIDSDSEIVQNAAGYYGPNLPIVAVHVFARTIVAIKMMGSGKAAFGCWSLAGE